MHDQGLGFHSGYKRYIGKDICPRWPSVHAWAENPHPCSYDAAGLYALTALQHSTSADWQQIACIGHLCRDTMLTC